MPWPIADIFGTPFYYHFYLRAAGCLHHLLDLYSLVYQIFSASWHYHIRLLLQTDNPLPKPPSLPSRTFLLLLFQHFFFFLLYIATKSTDEIFGYLFYFYFFLRLKRFFSLLQDFFNFTTLAIQTFRLYYIPRWLRIRWIEREDAYLGPLQPRLSPLFSVSIEDAQVTYCDSSIATLSNIRIPIRWCCPHAQKHIKQVRDNPKHTALKPSRPWMKILWLITLFGLLDHSQVYAIPGTCTTPTNRCDCDHEWHAFAGTTYFESKATVVSLESSSEGVPIAVSEGASNPRTIAEDQIPISEGDGSMDSPTNESEAGQFKPRQVMFADPQIAEGAKHLDLNSAKSRTEYIITYAGCPIVWESKLQTLVALSTTEAECIALSTSLREVIAVMNLVTELPNLGFNFSIDTPKIVCTVFEDNRSCLEIATNHRTRPRTKHLSVRLHHFRYHVVNNTINIQHVASKEQMADTFTKPLPRDQFIKVRNRFMGWYSLDERECEIIHLRETHD